MDIHFQIIQKESILEIIPLIQEFTDNKFSKEILEIRFNEMFTQSYECIGVFKGVVLIGLCGLWFQTRHYAGKSCEPDHVYIQPEYQGLGLGNKMFDYMTTKQTIPLITQPIFDWSMDGKKIQSSCWRLEKIMPTIALTRMLEHEGIEFITNESYKEAVKTFASSMEYPKFLLDSNNEIGSGVKSSPNKPSSIAPIVMPLLLLFLEKFYFLNVHSQMLRYTI